MLPRLFLAIFALVPLIARAEEKRTYPGVILSHRSTSANERALEAATKHHRYRFIIWERLASGAVYLTDRRHAGITSYKGRRGSLCRRAQIRRIMIATRRHVTCSRNTELQATTLPNDASYILQYAHAQMASSAAWDITTGSPSLVALVVDTGIDYNHPDLQANIWRNPAEIPNNGIDDDRNGYIDDVSGINTITGSGNPMDDNGHGTHVAGIIGAVGNNATGVVGINWTTKLAAAKFLSASGSGSTADAIKAITYGTALRAAGHRVIAMNNSWGGTTYSKPLLDAISAASDAGILFVAAAGNNARNNDSYLFYPASYKAPNVIAVASTDSTGALSSFSNFGSQSVHIAAPGSSIYSTVLRSTYGYKSGTSMAAPQVAGLALLTQSACEQLTLAGLKTTILSNGVKTSSLMGRVTSGSIANAAGAIIAARAACGAVTTPTPSPTRNPSDTATPTPTASPTPTITPTPTATPGHYLIATPSKVNPGTTVTFRASTGVDYVNYGKIEIQLYGPNGSAYPCDYTGYVPLTKGSGSVKVTIPDTAKFFSSMQFTFTSTRGRSTTVIESLSTTPTYVPYSRALLACQALGKQFR